MVFDTIIDETVENALTADLANGLSTCITKDGQTTTTQPIPFAAGIIYGGVTLANSVTGTGSMVLSASPTLTGTLTGTFAAFNGGGGGVNTTILGARSGNAAGSAIDGYQLAATGNAFRAQVDNVGAHLVDFYFSTTSVGSITTDTTSTAYNTSSDERLKENIKDADSAGSIIDALRVRQWNWKDGGKHEMFGFVAQEEVKVAPFAVTVGDDEKPWGRDDSRLVPLLVKEIQSLRARMAAAGIP